MFPILLLSLFSVWLTELSGLPQIITRQKWYPHERLKPFDCPLCFAWWLGLAWSLLNGAGWFSPLYGAACSVIAVILSKHLNS